MINDYYCLLKIVLVGDSGTGKSAIVTQYGDKKYEENFFSTIGVDFKIHTLTIDNKIVKLQIWDTAGQERFKSITSSYYKSANCIIFVYDVTDILSFVNLKIWINDMKIHTTNKYACIVGNKSDKIEDNEKLRCVNKSDAESFANKNNMFYIETSAKNNINIDILFNKIASDLLNSYELNISQQPTLKLENNKSVFSHYCGCNF